VDQMEKELLEADRLDPNFDYGGPDRSLGLLYRDAPSFISIGNRGKARDHLRHAIELAPEYPENRLNLIESYLKWGDRAGARQELAATERIWPEARDKFKGPAWAASWRDWEAQLQAFKTKSEESAKLQSPRH
jgi:tetratricopeptide (TPR) repeat protein